MTQRRSRLRAGTAVPLVLLLAALEVPRARAAEGALEIDQIRALAGGLTPGDTPGFPVTLSRRGAYRLTSNLDVRGQPTPAEVTAIVVTADEVSLDLAGFAVIGPTDCIVNTAPRLVSCTPLGTGRGINSSSRHTVVRNGSVTGFGDVGVAAVGVGSVVSDVHVHDNGGDGVLAGIAARVTRVSAYANGGDGVQVNTGVVWRSRGAVNGDAGIRALVDGLVFESGSGNDRFFGLAAGSRIGYARSVFSDGPGSVEAVEVDVMGTSVFPLSTNVCGLDTACP